MQSLLDRQLSLVWLQICTHLYKFVKLQTIDAEQDGERKGNPLEKVLLSLIKKHLAKTQASTSPRGRRTLSSSVNGDTRTGEVGARCAKERVFPQVYLGTILAQETLHFTTPINVLVRRGDGRCEAPL